MRGSAVLLSVTLATMVVLVAAQAPNNSHANSNSSDNPFNLIPIMQTNNIPYFDPGDGPATLVLDPLAPAVKTTPAPVVKRKRTKKSKRFESGSTDNDTTATPSLDCTTSDSALCNLPSPTPSPSPTATVAPTQTHPPVVPGSQCNANYTYGPVAVSVKGGGTFCAFAPVCSGGLNGNCPLLQPGLGGPARCEIVDGGVYGCVPWDSNA